MSDKLRKLLGDKLPGVMYVGEATLNTGDMNKAIEAVQRLSANGVYDKVSLHGDQAQCEAFSEDVFMVIKVFEVFAEAVSKGKPVPGGEVN